MLCASDGDDLRVSATPVRRAIDGDFARKIFASEAVFVCDDFIIGTSCDDFSSADTRARAEVDNKISSPHGIFIMLDHDNSITKIAQSFQAFDKPFVVSGMQSNAGFIKDIKNAHKAAANLAS